MKLAEALAVGLLVFCDAAEPTKDSTKSFELLNISRDMNQNSG